MKNKKLTYALLLLVLFVWGSIVFQIFGGSENDVQTAINKVKMKGDFQENTVDTFSLLLNYRDPFLGITTSIESSPRGEIQSSRHKPKENSKEKTEPSWPSVEFGGTISNKQAQSKMALIRINGNEHLMREGETKDGIQLRKIHNDSIDLAYMQVSKTIRK